MKINQDKLQDALALIGRNESLRNKFIELLKQAEQEISYEGHFRDEISAHIADALHFDEPKVTKKIANGLTFEFPYKSKIAREFVLAPENPNHVWEPQTTKMLLKLAENAEQVIIGGAYFGDHALLIADKIRNSGTVHAFEPSQTSSDALKENARINDLTNIIIKRAGLWNESGKQLQFFGDDALAGSEEAEENAAYSFPTYTIDEYAEKNGIEKFDLIMLDTEGGELRALEGAKNQLQNHSPHVVFEIHSLYSDWSNGLENADIIKFVKDFGYTVFAVRDFHHNHDTGDLPIELVLPEKTFIGDYEKLPHGFNMLAVKDVSTVQNDSFNLLEDVSPKYLLHKEAKYFHPQKR